MHKKSPTRLCNEFLILFVTLLLLEHVLIPINTYSIITCVLGLGMLVLFVYFSENGEGKIGLGTSLFDFGKSFLRAALLTGVPVLVVLALEQVLFLLHGNRGLFFDPSFELGYSTAENSSMESVGINGFLIWAGIGLAVSLVRALFFESAFRGFCLFIHAAEDYDDGNKRQAIYYTILTSIPTAYSIIQGIRTEVTQNRSAWIGVLTIIVTIVNAYLFAIRQGKLRFATGSIWVCVFSFWAFDYFNNMFKSFQTLPTDFTYYAIIYRSLAIQIAATVLTNIYLKKLRAHAISKAL